LLEVSDVLRAHTLRYIEQFQIGIGCETRLRVTIHVSFLRKRRGVSGIISGVFLVSVAVMIFNILAWQFFQYDAYHRTVLERDQREWERYNERLLIMEVITGTSNLNFTVRNYGAVTVHIVDLFLECLINGTNKYYSLDIWIGSGTTKRVIGPPIEPGLVYDFRIGTERGNVFAPSGQYIVNEPQPMGGQSTPFTLSFLTNSFQYIRKGETWSNNAKPAWYITSEKGSYIVFRLNITNMYQSDVRLLSGCHLLLITPDVQGNLNAAYKMFIVAEGATIDSNNKVPKCPTGGQMILSKKSVYVYFSAKTENGTDATQLINNAADNNYLNFVGTFYKVSGDPYDTIFGATAAVIAMQIKTTG